MLSVTSQLELFWNKRDRTVTKRNGIWIWIQLPFNENRIKISIKKSTFNLPINHLKLYKHQLSLSLKNYKPASKLRIRQSVKNFAPAVSLNSQKAGFSKTIFFRIWVKSCFFLTFNIFIRHTFLESFIETNQLLRKIWRFLFASNSYFHWLFWFFEISLLQIN